jgi:predicted nuclease with RNAse H fold
VLVAGIDLAASPANTAVALLDGRRVVDLVAGADDDRIVTTTAGATKVGIDCPLGWPQPFVDFLVAVRAGGAPPPAGTVAERGRLAYRATDRWVAEQCPPLRPLSVSADRIAHVTFRCAALLPRLDPTVDRTGFGRVVEVYPSGSLHAWGLPFRGYKGAAGASTRADIIAALATVVELGAHRARCESSDHALDAVVAAVSARAAARGTATLPTAADMTTAAAEGWIAIPRRTVLDLFR